MNLTVLIQRRLEFAEVVLCQPMNMKIAMERKMLNNFCLVSVICIIEKW